VYVSEGEQKRYHPWLFSTPSLGILGKPYHKGFPVSLQQVCSGKARRTKAGGSMGIWVILMNANRYIY
jgi:hypothetical protein